MKDFDALSNRGQQLRLRRLAERALAEYGVRRYAMRALLHRQNTTFRVDAAGRRYVLRISRPGAPPALIRSELQWLRAIRRDAALAVPEPVPAADGRLAVEAAAEGVPQARVCSLFGWVEGRFRRPEHFGPAAIGAVGRFMGELHRHAAGFAPPAGFARPRMDYAGIVGAAHGGSLEGLLRVVPAEGRPLVERVARRTRDAMRALGQGPEVFGLIHADLHAKNYLFDRGRVGAIDFDACSRGYYLSDIAATTRMLRHPRFSADQVADAFLAGYREARALPEGLRRRLGLFKAANSLMLAVWMSGRGDNPLLRAQAAEFIAHQLEQMRCWAA